MGPRRFLRVLAPPPARWLSAESAKEYLAERGIRLSERYFVRTIMTQVGGKIDGQWYCSAAELESWLEARLVRRVAATEASHQGHSGAHHGRECAPSPSSAGPAPEPAPAPTKGKPFVSRKRSQSARERIERLRRRDPK